MSNLARAAFEVYVNRLRAQIGDGGEQIEIDPTTFKITTDVIEVTCSFTSEGVLVEHVTTVLRTGKKTTLKFKPA